MSKSKFALSLVAVLSFIIIVSGCTVDKKGPNVEHSSDTITELNSILGELDDEAIKMTVQGLIDSPVEIERTFFTIDNKYYLVDIYNEEVAYFKQEPFSFQMECILDYASFVCYKSTYSEKCKNGSLKIHYLTVFAEVDEEGELMLPLHLYAYNRVIEKRTGMLETYTEPDFLNSFIEIGHKH